MQVKNKLADLRDAFSKLNLFLVLGIAAILILIAYVGIAEPSSLKDIMSYIADKPFFILLFFYLVMSQIERFMLMRELQEEISQNLVFWNKELKLQPVTPTNYQGISSARR